MEARDVRCWTYSSRHQLRDITLGEQIQAVEMALAKLRATSMISETGIIRHVVASNLTVLPILCRHTRRMNWIGSAAMS